MTAATNRVINSFQKVSPSRRDATNPVGSNNRGTRVASAEGDAKPPVTLTMVGRRREEGQLSMPVLREPRDKEGREGRKKEGKETTKRRRCTAAHRARERRPIAGLSQETEETHSSLTTLDS